MAIVNIDGKTITLPDEIARSEKLVKAAIAPHYPGVENAQIQIAEPATAGGPVVVTVTKRATPKGSLSATQQQIVANLTNRPPYGSPAIALAREAMRAEAMGDMQFLDAAVRRGEVERAISEAIREGAAVRNALRALGHSVPVASTSVPVGF